MHYLYYFVFFFWKCKLWLLLLNHLCYLPPDSYFIFIYVFCYLYFCTIGLCLLVAVVGLCVFLSIQMVFAIQIFFLIISSSWYMSCQPTWAITFLQSSHHPWVCGSSCAAVFSCHDAWLSNIFFHCSLLYLFLLSLPVFTKKDPSVYFFPSDVA